LCKFVCNIIIVLLVARKYKNYVSVAVHRDFSREGAKEAFCPPENGFAP